MTIDDNLVKIIGSVIAFLVVVVGASWITIRKTKTRNSRTNQSHINISGSNSKVVGGDDNSRK